jgi:uncharacterized membrane protein
MMNQKGNTMTITLVILAVLCIMGLTVTSLTGFVTKQQLNTISQQLVLLDMENKAYQIVDSFQSDSSIFDSETGAFTSSNGQTDWIQLPDTEYSYQYVIVSDAPDSTTGEINLDLHREGKEKIAFFTFSYQIVENNGVYSFTYQLKGKGTK